jgi:hypothetical protein
MKKLICLLITSLTLNAQTGDGATAAAKANDDSYWQNWAFMATAIVTATAAVVYIAYNNGRDASSD